MVRAMPLPDTRCVKPELSAAARALTCRSILRSCVFVWTLAARLYTLVPLCNPLGGEHGNGAKETFEAAKRLAAFRPSTQFEPGYRSARRASV
ncbi:hypothetical protein BZM27_49555 [Paraburkholderia steynii]|uniref:Uncharacterized protein n=1 Tax=Paraburkholderia steynii TaxID=1245441 RepID=A0A4R0X3L5_9BURK|nr:hypothetical protein BZM27_49555 [Paraburkholderia steynii]